MTVALALFLVSAACGDDDSTTTLAETTTTNAVTTTTEASGNPTGGEVVVGLLEEPVTLNWFAPGGDAASAGLVGAGLWAGVADVDGETLGLVPDVVVALPTVANGGLVVNGDGSETVSYVIDPDAVWADGTPISGEDFAFTYQVIMDPAHGLDRSGYEAILPESLVVGAKTFTYTLANPTLAVEGLFNVLIPAHQVQGTDPIAAWSREPWVSGGGFVVEEWVPGEFVSLVRNPEYWKRDAVTGQGLPYLDRVVFRFLPDVETMLAEFAARRLDVVGVGSDLTGVDVAALTAQGAVLQVAGSGHWEHLSFQFGEGRLARNPGSYNQYLEFRRAVAHAIDRQALAQGLFGGNALPLDSYLEAFTPAWSTQAWAQYDYDPDQARQHLADLCALEGVDCQATPPRVVFTTSSVDPRVQLAELLEPMLTQVGIEFESQLEARVVFFGETIEYGTYDLGLWFWVGSPGLASAVRLLQVWDPRQAPPIGTNYYRFGSPAFSGEPDLAAYSQGPSSLINEGTERMAAIIDSLATTIDEATIVGLLQEAETILADQLAFIPLFQYPDVALVWGEAVANFHHASTGATGAWNRVGFTWNIAEWYQPQE